MNVPIEKIAHEGLNPDPETFEERVFALEQDLEENENAELEEELENGDNEDELDASRFFGLEVHRNDLDEK